MKFKLEMQARRRRRALEESSKPLSRARRAAPRPEFQTVEVPHLGSIDCGNVLPFIQTSELVTVVIPSDIPVGEVFTLKVRGVSLTKLKIYDGDLLVCRRKFSTHQITERTVCAVYIHSTGELVAKRIIRG